MKSVEYSEMWDKSNFTEEELKVGSRELVELDQRHNNGSEGESLRINFEAIENAIVDFLATASVRPTALYVGRKEMHEIRKYTDGIIFRPQGCIEPSLWGLVLYEVDEETYLGIGSLLVPKEVLK